MREPQSATTRSHAVFMSVENHQVASLPGASSVAAELEAVFGDRLCFLGTLSDRAVSNALRNATYAAAFFQTGARANNTSIASAMEHGAVVITNLDRYSPAYLVDGQTVVDIETAIAFPTDDRELERLRAAAREAVSEASWDHLAERLSQTPGTARRR